MLTMLLHVMSCLIFVNGLICSSIMDHSMVIVQIHLNVVLLLSPLVICMIVLYRFLALYELRWFLVIVFSEVF